MMRYMEGLVDSTYIPRNKYGHMGKQHNDK